MRKPNGKRALVACAFTVAMAGAAFAESTEETVIASVVAHRNAPDRMGLRAAPAEASAGRKRDANTVHRDGGQPRETAYPQVVPLPYERPAAPAEPTPAYTRLLDAYEDAIFASSVYDAANVRELRPLTPDANGDVVVVALTSRDGKVGELFPVGTGAWVTAVPEVQNICRHFRDDLPMRLRQLLGLPPDASVPRMIVLRVHATNLFRPAVDPDTSTTLPCEQLHDAPTAPDCGSSYPSNTSAAHYLWMAQAYKLHQLPSGYPWTHLGYTYNWTPGADRYGASEYVIRAGAPALIVENVPPEVYCQPPQP